MLRGRNISWVFVAGIVGAVASLAPACGGTGEGATESGGSSNNNPSSSSNTAVCGPDDLKKCQCEDGSMSTQTCKEDGTGFLACDCAGGAVCGNGKVEGNEQCDDGNKANGDGCNSDCTTGTNLCGNGVKDPGECGKELGTCPQDCGNCGNGVEDPGECGASGDCPVDCDPCKDHVTFAGLVGPSGPVWTYGGDTGLDAGQKMCANIGADHVCSYQELRAAEMHMVNNASELATIPNNTTIWLNRLDTEMVPVGGVMTPGGAGARCNNWKYATNHISDGEFCTWNAATPALNCEFDNDPSFDQMAPKVQPGLQCGGEMRSIACCFEACKQP